MAADAQKKQQDMRAVVKQFADNNSISVVFRGDIAILMAHNSVDDNGKKHAASIVDMSEPDLISECNRAYCDLDKFIKKHQKSP